MELEVYLDSEANAYAALARAPTIFSQGIL
jgi:hypothetical protein